MCAFQRKRHRVRCAHPFSRTPGGSRLDQGMDTDLPQGLNLEPLCPSVLGNLSQVGSEGAKDAEQTHLRVSETPQSLP